MVNIQLTDAEFTLLQKILNKATASVGRAMERRNRNTIYEYLPPRAVRVEDYDYGCGGRNSSSGCGGGGNSSSGCGSSRSGC